MESINKLLNRSLREAFELRKSLSLSTTEPANALVAATAMGVDVRFQDCPSLEGMYLRDRRPRIFLPHNDHRPRGRILFSCAHELGHHQLGHGTSADKYTASGSEVSKDSPEEIAADAFASHLLMPRHAVADGFKRRGFDITNPSPQECFVVSQELGVGFTTLLVQMSVGLKLLPYAIFSSLRKHKPSEIRRSMWEESRQTDLIVIDQFWHSNTCDVRVGDYVTLPMRTNFCDRQLRMVGSSNELDASVVQVICVGKQRIKLECNRHVEIRASKKGFTGTYRNSFLEDPDT